MSEIKRGDRVKVTVEGTVTAVWNWGELDVDFDDLQSEEGTVTVATNLVSPVIPDEPPLWSIVEVNGNKWYRGLRGWSPAFAMGTTFNSLSWAEVYKPGFKVAKFV